MKDKYAIQVFANGEYRTLRPREKSAPFLWDSYYEATQVAQEIYPEDQPWRVMPLAWTQEGEGWIRRSWRKE